MRSSKASHAKHSPAQSVKCQSKPRKVARSNTRPISRPGALGSMWIRGKGSPPMPHWRLWLPQGLGPHSEHWSGHLVSQRQASQHRSPRCQLRRSAVQWPVRCQPGHKPPTRRRHPFSSQARRHCQPWTPSTRTRTPPRRHLGSIRRPPCWSRCPRPPCRCPPSIPTWGQSAGPLLCWPVLAG